MSWHTYSQVQIDGCVFALRVSPTLFIKKSLIKLGRVFNLYGSHTSRLASIVVLPSVWLTFFPMLNCSYVDTDYSPCEAGTHMAKHDNKSIFYRY
jgi:hypothetical protein